MLQQTVSGGGYLHEKVFNYTSHLSGHTSRFLPGNTVVYLHMILTLYHSATGCMVSEDALQAPPSDGARCGGSSARDQTLRGCAADHGGFRLPMAYSHDILINKNGTRNPLCPVLGGSLPAQDRRSAPSAGGRRRGITIRSSRSMDVQGGLHCLRRRACPAASV